MASSSSTYRSSSSSDGGNNNPSDSVVTVDERKRKRMLSNRESARRSRMRKQKHVDDLTAQINQLSNDNRQILESLIVTSQLYMKIQADNSVLTAQMSELTTRLQSLNEIVDLVQSNGAGFGVDQIDGCGFDDRTVGIDGYYDDTMSGGNVMRNAIFEVLLSSNAILYNFFPGVPFFVF